MPLTSHRNAPQPRLKSSSSHPTNLTAGRQASTVRLTTTNPRKARFRERPVFKYPRIECVAKPLDPPRSGPIQHPSSPAWLQPRCSSAASTARVAMSKAKRPVLAQSGPARPDHRTRGRRRHVEHRNAASKATPDRSPGPPYLDTTSSARPLPYRTGNVHSGSPAAPVETTVGRRANRPRTEPS